MQSASGILYFVNFNLRILAVDDDPLVSTLLKQTLQGMGYDVETAHSAAEASKVAKVFDPDIAIVDVDLGAGPDGFDLATALKNASPALAVVFLTNVSDPRLAGKTTRNLPAGAGYLLKSKMGDSRELGNAIEEVARGRGKNFRDDLQVSHPLKKLSNSQLEVVRLLANGKSNEEIALIRGTTVRAVRLILVRAFKALGISESGGSERRVQAALEYMKVAGIPK
jgi:DNA-binding NarL/FixJ family response regulator